MIAVGLSVFLKFVTRNDAHKSFKKEDLAVGLDLSVTALLIIVTAGSAMAKDLTQSSPDQALLEKTQSVPWIIAAYILGIWGVSTIVRKFGWKSDEDLRIGWGIALPGAFGLASLFFAVNWITQ